IVGKFTFRGVNRMQFIETMIELVESVLHLVIGLVKFIIAIYLLVLIISNPLIFLFVVLFCPGVFSFVMPLMVI
ncbi:MAG: hypothetical protein PHD82_16845, partial [Candidatus Riflebacteria bacterium]|nr:hypothetical protein [Candidatus Riflebacteria bacterium]